MKLKNILFAAALPALAFLAACKPETTPEVKKPTTTFQTGAGFTFTTTDSYYDSVLKIGVRAASTDDKLTKITISVSVNGAAAGVIKDTTFNSKTLTWDYKYIVKGSVGDQQTIIATAFDKNGSSTSASFVVNIIPQTVALSTVAAQKVNNLIGPDPGAYDLFSQVSVISVGIDSTKDLKDMTPSSGVFPKSWTSGTGKTKFARATGNPNIDWNNATSSTYLFNSWKLISSAASKTITNLVKDDIIMVQTGQVLPFNIYIIKITEVFETVGNNNDYIKFDYKGFTK